MPALGVVNVLECVCGTLRVGSTGIRTGANQYWAQHWKHATQSKVNALVAVLLGVWRHSGVGRAQDEGRNWPGTSGALS